MGFFAAPDLYVWAEGNMGRGVLEQVVESAEARGAQRVYVAVQQCAPHFAPTVSTLRFLGFEPVPAHVQRQLFFAKGLLLTYDL